MGFVLLTGFCHEHALILYVYLSNDDTESVLTVRPSPSSKNDPFTNLA